MILCHAPSARAFRRAHLVVLALAAFGGCGGKVVFSDGSSGGAGGSSSNGSTDCILGKCGDACTKCIGAKCSAGKCDTNGTCQPVDLTFTCGK